MNDLQFNAQVERTISYEKLDPPFVFRLAWFVSSSFLGARLIEENEAESQVFVGEARFSVKIDDHETLISCKVDESDSSITISVHGDDETVINKTIESIESNLNQALTKINVLNEEEQNRIGRAFVAKCCVDRIVYHVLNNSPTSDIYFQVAHAREMMVKAAAGDEAVNPLALSTAGWLSKIEPLPREEKMPSNIAKEIALKSVEWKKQIQSFIKQFI